jgi:hypothetical protein
MAALIDLAGARFGRLVVLEKAEGRTAPGNGRTLAAWLCRCDCGGEVVVLGGNLRNGNTKSCGCLWLEAQRGRGADGRLRYRHAHALVERARGKASEQTCACGKPALDWSYDGGAPDEMVEVRGLRAMRYSGDPEAYSARCRGCHWRQARGLEAS